MVYDRMNKCRTYSNESQFDSPSGSSILAFKGLKF